MAPHKSKDSVKRLADWLGGRMLVGPVAEHHTVRLIIVDVTIFLLVVVEYTTHRDHMVWG